MDTCEIEWQYISSKAVILNCRVCWWIQGGSLGSYSTDICRLLQLCEEEDDASSPLTAPKPEPNDQALQAGGNVIFQEVSFLFPFGDG